MIKVPLALLAASLLLPGVPWSPGSGGGGEEQATLKYQVPSKWEYYLPAEAPIALATDKSGSQVIPIAHAGGEGFVVEVDGAALAVDTNGDGKVDDKVRGVSGSVTLRGKSSEGASFTYAARFVKVGAQWQYAPGGVMSGKLCGHDIKLVDLNGNGRYDDFGADAMIVGRGNAGSFLSRVVSLGGTLYEVTVSATGDSITAKPFEGESGTLNVREGFKSEGELLQAVVANARGDVSFELSDCKKGLVVPVGEYRIVAGAARKGSENVRIRAGNSKPIAVASGAEASLQWGAPLVMDFEFSREKEKVTIQPTVKYFGSAGEEYYEFKPDAKSPKILIVDAKSGKKITEGRFGGC
jgi:hypothetical protein